MEDKNTFCPDIQDNVINLPQGLSNKHCSAPHTHVACIQLFLPRVMFICVITSLCSATEVRLPHGNTQVTQPQNAFY